VLCPRATLFAAEKRMNISRPLFLEYLIFFCLFQFFKSLKKNKIMLHYKGGTSVTINNTSSKHKEHTNAQSKETCAGKGHSGKIPPWVKVSGHKGKKFCKACI
jgi:hypothetical protein